ncbi:MAG: hypothetical protein AABY22_08975 [Nanoarchaeota archaeon]
MNGEREAKTRDIGFVLGIIFSYLVFSTILYLILNFLKKIPLGWNYLHISVIILTIVLFGILIKMVLKIE